MAIDWTTYDWSKGWAGLAGYDWSAYTAPAPAPAPVVEAAPVVAPVVEPLIEAAPVPVVEPVVDRSALAFQGLTRQGEQLYATNERTEAELIAALKAGVDIGQIGEGKWLTGAFDTFEDYLTKAPQLASQFKTYASDPTKYAITDPTKLAAFSQLPEYNALESLWGGNGLNYSVYDKSAYDTMMSSLANNYTAFDPTKLGDDAFSQALQRNLIDLGNGTNLMSKSDSEYFSGLNSALQDSRIGYYGADAFADPLVDPSYAWRYTGVPIVTLQSEGNYYDYVPYEAAARVFGGPNGITVPYDLIGNEALFDQQVAYLPSEFADTIKWQDAWGTPYAFDNPNLGYLFEGHNSSEFWDVFDGAQTAGWTAAPNWDFNVSAGYGSGVVNDEQFAGDWLQRLTPATYAKIAGLEDNNLAGSLAAAGINPTTENVWWAPGMQDFSGDNLGFSGLYIDPEDQQIHASAWGYEYDDGNFLTKIMSEIAPILPILNFIPGINAFTIPFTATTSLLNGLKTGDIGQIASGAFGLAGVAGFNPLGEITGGIGNALAGIEGLEFLGSGFSGPLTQTQGAIADALKGMVQGGVQGFGSETLGDFGESLLGGALSGGTGSYLGSLDLGGAGSWIDKLLPSVGSGLAKDFVLSGGENFADILTSAGATALGNMVGGETFDALKTRPEFDAETGSFRIGDIGYSITGEPQGYYDGNTFTTYASIAEQNGGTYDPTSSGSLGALASFEDGAARKLAQAAGTGVSKFLMTGDIEAALLAAIPQATSGAIDELFGVLGIDLGDFDLGAIVGKLVGAGVERERATELAEAAKEAHPRTVAARAAEETANAAAAEELANANAAEGRARAAQAKARKANRLRGVSQNLMNQSQSREYPTGRRDEEPVSVESDGMSLDPALAQALAVLESMGVELDQDYAPA